MFIKLIVLNLVDGQEIIKYVSVYQIEEFSQRPDRENESFNGAKAEVQTSYSGLLIVKNSVDDILKQLKEG